MHPMRDKIAVAGVGASPQGKFPGATPITLATTAFKRALDDCGLKKEQIDGILTMPGTTSPEGALNSLRFGEAVGINPRYINGTMLGGSSFVAHILPAMMALQSGQCNAVLVCYGSTQRTSTFGRAEIAQARRVMDPQPYETPYAPMQPLSAYALATRRHMHQYGTTRRDLAEVAVLPGPGRA